MESENVWINGNNNLIVGRCGFGDFGFECHPAYEAFTVNPGTDGNCLLKNAILTYYDNYLGDGGNFGSNGNALHFDYYPQGDWVQGLVLQDVNIIDGGVKIQGTGIIFENVRIKILPNYSFLSLYEYGYQKMVFNNLTFYNISGEIKFTAPISFPSLYDYCIQFVEEDCDLEYCFWDGGGEFRTPGCYEIGANDMGWNYGITSNDINIFSEYVLLGNNQDFRFQDSNGTITLDYNYHVTQQGPVMAVNDLDTGELMLCPIGVCSNLHETNSWSMDVNSFDTYSLYGIFDNGLRILRPKDEIFNTTIDKNWGIDIGGDMVAHITNINTDYYDINWTNDVEKTYIIDVYDMNGEYNKRRYALVVPAAPFTYYELQPYLINKNQGTSVLLHTLSVVNSSVLPFIRIKVWKNIGEPTIRLVEDVITDDKGEAYVFLENNGLYTFDTYYDSNIFIKQFNITATKPNIYLYLDLGGTITPIDIGGISASWTPISPSIKAATTGTTNFTATLHNSDNKSISITTTIKTTSGINLDTPQTWTGTTTHTFTFTADNADMNESLVIVTMQVTTIDGNTHTFTKTYYTTNSFGANYNIFWGLSTGLKQDFRCSSDSNIPCFPLLTLAIIITIAFGLYLSNLAGQFGSQNISIIFTIILGLFTYLGWVPIILMGAVVFIVLVFVINERRS